MPKRGSKSEDQLREERARHLAYVGTLASGLAHEIRSPLNSMKLNLELLEEELGHVSAERRELFQRRLRLVGKELQGLQDLLTEFLTFARPPRMQMLATDINHLLLQVIEMVTPECQRAHIEIVTDFQPDLYPVALDQHQFGRGVILNLLNNAREQIEKQGTITIRTRETENHISIEVEDNGGGVQPDKHQEIFRPFFSTKAHGTGLGLAIAKRIVNEHGGELSLVNHPARGANFIITLPKSKILPVQL